MQNTPDLPIVRRADRVAIDLRQVPGAAQQNGAFAIDLQPDDPPARTNLSDVVLLRSNFYEFDNRWKDSDELVDYDVIQSDVERLDLNLARLRRMKICEFQFKLQAHAGLWTEAPVDLLRFLSGNTSLVQLEVDSLNLRENTIINLQFPALQVLSISAIRISNSTGLEDAPKEIALIRLEVPQLTKLYTGEDLSV